MVYSTSGPYPGATISSLPSASFTKAVESLRRASVRPDLLVEEIDAPQQLAPYSFALAARVRKTAAHPDNSEKAAARLVLLFDPAGHDAWEGTTRLVSYTSARIKPDIADDPALAAVTWAWLTDALATHNAHHRALAGAVTAVTSTHFPYTTSGENQLTDIEIRASWTPRTTHDLASHTVAWGEVLAAAAGLPPAGITRLA